MAVMTIPTLLDPAVRQDPYPVYATLRREDPVHWDAALGRWLVTRYDDVAAGLRDPRFSSQRSAALNANLPAAVQAELAPSARARATAMLFTDPPTHTRLRRLVNRAFTPRLVEALRGGIQALVDELLDAVQPAGRMDAIRDLAYPLPASVIAQMLGAPPTDRDRFKAWSDDIALSLTPASPEAALRGQRSGAAMGEYMAAIIADRRARPREDLISALVAAEEQGDALSSEELYAMCSLLLVAGHETTTNLIGNGLLALLRHPDQQRRLRQQPDLWRSGVEELLRFDSPVQLAARVLREDVELRGRRLRAGQVVAFLIGSANRDAEQFPEPDRLDVGRQDNRHLAFGAGIHYCLGAPLARLEAQLAFATLLRRLPHLELAADHLDYRPSVGFRALQSLPVTFRS